MFRLRVLGPATLIRPDGSAVPLVGSQPKLLGLLTYLAVNDRSRPPRRDTLLPLFWPEMDEAGARHALSQALSVIRRELGPDVMNGKWRDHVALSMDGLWCDAAAFSAAVRERRDADAMELYRGTLLEGFNSTGTPEFERWLEDERGTFARLAVQAAARLSARTCQEMKWQEASEWARRAVRLDPYDEAAWRLLFTALDGGGDRAAALAEFDRMAQRLNADLGATPSPETTELINAIRSRPAAPLLQATPKTIAPHSSPAPAPAANESRPRPYWYRRRLPLVFAAITVLATAVLAVRARSGRDIVIGKAAGAQLPVVLAAFGSAPGDSSLALATMLALRIDMAQSPHVRVLEQQRIENALRRMRKPDNQALDLATAREVAIREGVTAVVTGEIRRAGGRYILTGRVVTAKEGGDVIAVRESARDSTELIDVINRLSRRMRRAFGESAELLQSQPSLAHVTTHSLEALRYFSEAERAPSEDASLALLDQAIANDSLFAMAHWKKAKAYAAWGPKSKHIEAVRKAWLLRDRLPEPERSYAAADYYRVIEEAPQKTFAVWQALLRRDPDDVEALVTMTDVFMRRHQLDTAWSFASRAVRARRDFVSYYNAFVVAMARGDFAAADTVLHDLAERLPEHSFNARLRGEYFAGQRKYAEAARYLALYRDNARIGTLDRAGANAMLAVVAEARGRIEEAKAHLRSDLQESERLGPTFVVARSVQLASLMARFGEVAAARNLVRRTLEQYPLETIPPADRPLGALAAFYVRVGDTAVVAAHLRRTNGRPGGGLLVARGKYVEAIAWYRDQIRSAPAECMSCGMYELAHVHDLAGQADSAIAIYKRAIATTGSRTVRADAEWLGRSYERLAELLRAAGDTSAARDYYARIAELYADGDAHVRQRVQRASRHARLLPAR